MKSYVYLHGFASSPASSKAQYFKARLLEHNIELHIPALDGGDFENLTLTGQLAVVERLLNGRPAVLMGSSMGGYLAALYAKKHAEVEQVVLLAPAFDFWTRWAESPGWETGKLSLYHYGENRQREVHYGLIEDARAYPGYPDFRQPALVLHGLHDDVVPVEYARRFCKAHPNAKLVEFDSGHELTNVLPEIWALVETFLFA